MSWGHSYSFSNQVVRSKDMVEQLGQPYYNYVPETSLCLDWDTIRVYHLYPFYPFQCLSNLSFYVFLDIYKMARVRERKTRDFKFKCIKDETEHLLVKGDEIRHR